MTMKNTESCLFHKNTVAFFWQAHDFQFAGEQTHQPVFSAGPLSHDYSSALAVWSVWPPLGWCRDCNWCSASCSYNERWSAEPAEPRSPGLAGSSLQTQKTNLIILKIWQLTKAFLQVHSEKYVYPCLGVNIFSKISLWKVEVSTMQGSTIRMPDKPVNITTHLLSRAR